MIDHTILAKIHDRLTRHYDGEELARHKDKLDLIVSTSPSSLPRFHIGINAFIRRTFA